MFCVLGLNEQEGWGRRGLNRGVGEESACDKSGELMRVLERYSFQIMISLSCGHSHSHRFLINLSFFLFMSFSLGCRF